MLTLLSAASFQDLRGSAKQWGRAGGHPGPYTIPLSIMQILLPQQASPADAPAMVPHSAQQPQAEPPQPLHSAAGVAQEIPPQQPAAPHQAVDAEDSRVQLAALAPAPTVPYTIPLSIMDILLPQQAGPADARSTEPVRCASNKCCAASAR